MIAIIFELSAADTERYFGLAAALKPELEALDGFISVERFQSLADPDKYLSLSFFRNEAAVKAWRTRTHHRGAQCEGRAGVLADYRLRVAEVLRDYGMNERAQAPTDSVLCHG